MNHHASSRWTILSPLHRKILTWWDHPGKQRRMSASIHIHINAFYRQNPRLKKNANSAVYWERHVSVLFFPPHFSKTTDRQYASICNPRIWIMFRSKKFEKKTCSELHCVNDTPLICARSMLLMCSRDFFTDHTRNIKQTSEDFRWELQPSKLLIAHSIDNLLEHMVLHGFSTLPII